jgi:hypothetical protein
MSDLAAALSALLFILGAYVALKLVERFLGSSHETSFVWCSRMRCFSLIDTDTKARATGPGKTITRCLLWPELHDCNQRCVK